MLGIKIIIQNIQTLLHFATAKLLIFFQLKKFWCGIGFMPHSLPKFITLCFNALIFSVMTLNFFHISAFLYERIYVLLQKY